MERRLSIKDYRWSKVRGARRKCNGMIESIREATLVFPEEHALGWGFWHMHLPVDQAFIDSQKTPYWVRRQCMQCLIDGAERLRNLKPISDKSVQVIASISLPRLWDSQITVLLGQDYISAPIEQDSEWHRLEPLRESRSISREWGLKIPDGFQERGYHERICDQDYSQAGEVWFIESTISGDPAKAPTY